MTVTKTSPGETTGESLGRAARRVSARGGHGPPRPGKQGLGGGDSTPGVLGSAWGAGAAPLSPNAATSISRCQSSPQTCSGVPAPRGSRSLLRGALQLLGRRKTITGSCRPTPGHGPRVNGEPSAQAAAGLPAGKPDREKADRSVPGINSLQPLTGNQTPQSMAAPSTAAPPANAPLG